MKKPTDPCSTRGTRRAVNKKTWHVWASSPDPFPIDGSFGCYLNKIQFLIHHGDKIAAEKLFNLAWDAVSTLAESVKEQPEMFRWFAEKLSVWPGNVGIRGAPSSICLGKKYSLNLVGKQCGSIEAEIATSFFWVINSFRKLRKNECTNEAYEWKIAIKARKLKPLNRNNYKQWFKVAETELLLSEFGENFENHKKFNHYWKGDAYKEVVPDNPIQKRLVKNARALIRRDIKKQIKQAFRSIAARSSAV